MVKITTPVEGFTGVVAGVAFVDGAGETSDPGALQYFYRHGYDVEVEDAGEKSLDKMKVDELKAYADAHSIDLGEATKKADILTVIQAASEESPGGDPTGDQPAEQK